MLIKSTNRLIAILSLLLLKYGLFVSGQSNYASHANNVEYRGEGLPEEATLDGKVTKLDDLSPIIFLNRTKAALNCGAGSMQVDLKFNEKFYGLAYADFDRNSACQIIGKGDLSYRIELPLKGCGTKQEPQRVFTNNIVVRFHPGLEMDGDEIITIVCRYPPPVAPIPAGLPAPIFTDVVPASIIEPPLKGIQILFIICAIMFLTLVLLGLGVSYYCLKRRPIPIVRRLPMSMGSGSEITKLSGSSLGNISAFEGLKIPRAHAPLQQVQSSSGSDGPLISDTIPSDYPSESHSEIEDVDTRSLPVSSAGSYDNRAYIQDGGSSIYSEHYGHTQEIQAVAFREPSPKFDVQVRVKKAAPLPPSPQTSDTESIAASRVERNNLSTIMESHEDRDSIFTIDSMPHDVAHTHFTYTPELHPAPKYIQAPPIFSKIMRKQQQEIVQREHWPEDYADGPPAPPPPPPQAPSSVARSLVSLGTEMTDTHSMTEMVDSSHLYPNNYYRSTIEFEQTDSLPEPPISVMKKPEITSHVVDDVFLRTITEKRTIEDIEKHKRMVTEYKPKPVPDPKWDVTIRNYPTDGTGPQWEDFSDISSASGMTATQIDGIPPSIPPPTYISHTGEHLRSPQLVGNMKPIEIPPEDKAVPNWDVLIRILEEPDMPEVDDASSEHSTAILQRHLSYDDKTKWKEIITTESSLRSMLTEAVVREDFERIRTDVRYESLFEPQSWDVIIRILAPPDDTELRGNSKKQKKREAWDTRSRRSSLPTLYEYDSDGGSSVRTITNEQFIQQASQGQHYAPRSRKTSRSSYRSDNVDMRSMTEVTVDFARPDSISDGSSFVQSGHGYYPEDGYDRRSIQRSLSHPSLARSASEFTERWIAPDDASEISSSEGSPHARRSQRVMTTFQPHPNIQTQQQQIQHQMQIHQSQQHPQQQQQQHQIIRETQYVAQRTTNYQTGQSHGGASSNEWYSEQRQN